MNYKLLLALLVLLVYPQLAFSQKGALQGQARIDSLVSELPNAKSDTNHVKLYAQLSGNLYGHNPDKGIEYGLKGVELAKTIGDKDGEANCYSSLGTVYKYGKGLQSKALEYYQKSLKIKEKLGVNTSGLIHNIAGIHFNQSKIDLAKKGFLRAIEMNKKPGGNRVWLANNYSQVAKIYRHLSDYSKSREFYNKALKIYKEFDDQSGIANVSNAIGLIYLSESNLPKALEYMHRSVKIRIELGDKRGHADVLNNIGSIYCDMSEFEKGLEYMERALKIREELGDKMGHGIALVNIGSIYSESISDNQKGLEYVQRALKIAKEIENKSLIAYALGTLGTVNQRLGDYSGALENYHKELKIHKDFQNKIAIAHTLGNLGSIYFAFSSNSGLSKLTKPHELVSSNPNVNLDKSIKLYHESINIFDKINELTERSVKLKHLANAYHRKGDHKNSDRYFREHKFLQDSVFNSEKSKEIGKLEAIHDIEIALQKEEAKAKEDARLQAEETSRRDTLQYSGITIFTVILFAVIFFVSRKNISISKLDTLTFIAFLLLYEFILVFADPYIEEQSGGEPVYQLGMNFLIAMMFIPLQKLERKFKKNYQEKNSML